MTAIQIAIKSHLEMAAVTIRAGAFDQAIQELRSVLKLANNHNPALRSSIFRALNVIRPLVR